MGRGARARKAAAVATAAVTAAAAVILAAGAAPPTRPAPRAPAPAAERCGWIVNPTPGNWSLVDRDGSWEIAAQGSYHAEGMDRIPDLSARDWTVTNGSSYGYGCGCMRVAADARRQRIARILSVRQKPLSACRADPRLKRPH
jgi:hypothetical protein